MAGLLIKKEDTVMRKSISPAETHSIHFLLTGETFTSLSYVFRISHYAISEIVIETCKVLLSALNGKHVILQAPKHSGSYYHNYKGRNSIVLLMSLVDADLKLVYVDVGTNGRVSDDGVWNKTSLC
ncbi:unnamed protein product [Coregonus sp. 'balchen']|nr:unnamed protein product [Coregonus sp. 'balchen']